MQKIKINDLIDYQFISLLSANPSKTNHAYVLSKPNIGENNYQSTLYVGTHKALDLETSKSYFWETDTSLLIPFAKNEDEKQAQKEMKTILYRYDLNLKTFEYLTTLYVPVYNLIVVNEETWIIQTSLSEKEHVLYEDPANRDDYLKQVKDQDLYEIIETIPFYSDGGTFTRSQKGQILSYNPKTKVYTNLFDKDISTRVLSYNKHTKKLYILAKEFTQVLDFYSDAYTYHVETQELKKVYENDNALAIGDFFELNETTYLFASDNKKYGINQNSDFYLLKEGVATHHTDFGRSSYNSTGSDVRLGGNVSTHIIADKYYFVGTYQDRTVLYQFDGTLTEIYAPKGSIDGILFLEDTVLGVGLFDNKLQELYHFNLEDNSYTQITNHNTDALKDKYVAKPIYHNIVDGEDQMDGWVLLPENYDEEKKYPAILDIHGGPKTIYNENFFHEMQVWANAGYIVFFCNPRGGDGYGDDFADIRGLYGSIDYQDIMDFTDFVLKNYAIDENRMGVTGGSYGGFMTNWIVSHTDRFKAAATQRSISNWISFYGTSDIGYYFGPDQTDADPLDDFEKAWEHSPLKHARNIKTPLLFIHSDQDYRCPIEQAMQLYTVVKKQGVDTRFVWFKNENHNLSRGGKPKSRIKRLEEITQWMDLYLNEK